jgi:hypothetical protein
MAGGAQSPKTSLKKGRELRDVRDFEDEKMPGARNENLQASRRPDPSEVVRDVEQLYERFGISQNTRQFDIAEPPKSSDQHAFDGEQNDYVVVYEHRISHNTHITGR